jgi:hypothetical protein
MALAAVLLAPLASLGRGDVDVERARTSCSRGASSAAVASAPASSSCAAPPSSCPPPARALYALYLEAGGTALVWSANYEIRPMDLLGIRVGFGAYPFDWLHRIDALARGGTVYAVPAMLTLFPGSGRHRVELGAGVAVFSKIERETVVAPALSIGYRNQGNEGGVVFRVAVTPLISPMILLTPTIVPVGLGIGAAF